MRRACGILLLACGALFASSGTAHADVAVITRVPEDDEVRRQLAGLIDEPVNEHDESASAAQPLPVIMKQAAGWTERYVVVIDRAGQSVHVLRPSDQTMASRLLEEEVLAHAHYAVALATAELLEWLGVTARAEPVGAGRDRATRSGEAPRPAIDSTDADADAVPHVPAELSVAVGAGLELSASPGYDPELSRLAVEAGLELGRLRRPLWSWLSLRASLLGSASDAQLGASAAGAVGAERIEYGSTTLAVQGGLGLGRGEAALMVGPVLGLALGHADAQDQDGASLGSDDEVSPLLGLSLGLRYPLLWGLSLSLAAEGQWLVQPTRYRVDGAVALEEGPLQVLTRLGLSWESALLP